VKSWPLTSGKDAVRRALGDPEDDLFKQALDFFLSYYREHKLTTPSFMQGYRRR
jgi:hypothetical protein